MIRSARKVPLNFYKFIENRMKNDELFSDDNLANKRTGESLSQYLCAPIKQYGIFLIIDIKKQITFITHTLKRYKLL